MRLATALTERADLQKRIDELGNRLTSNAKVQDGEKPAEEPEALLTEMNALFARLEELITQINLTNTATIVDGQPLTVLLAKRDCLKKKLSIMRNFLQEASIKVQRYSRTEIRIKSTVDVAKLQKQVDKLAKELRETDEKIQETNWTTELIE